ncbi:CHAT domain-containing protein [Mycena leptocephala]|nr:CHAT domain-containing protein [Mycena leptocephala]
MQHNYVNLAAAVRTWQEAEALLSWGHKGRGSLLNNLANALHTRFEQQGDAKDIDDCITLHKEALDTRPVSDPDRGSSLNNLASAIQTRFIQRGDSKDIDEAVTLHREALEIRPAPDRDRASSLNNLAAVLQRRFMYRGDPRDIDEAIILHREALEICPAPHHDHAISLNNLAIALQRRVEQSGDTKDIVEAISLLREALELRPAPHIDRALFLGSLANSIQTRFQRWGDPKDIDEAIALNREALKICAAPHECVGTLQNLAAAIQTRFERQGDSKDIDEAVMLNREALEIRAMPHSDRGSSLNNLAHAMRRRFELGGNPEDMDEAISLHIEASTYRSSSPLIRLFASREWVRSATRHGHPSSLDAYQTAIDLLPHLAAFSLDLKSRQQMLARKEIVSLASASAICAIGMNQIDRAVEFLEVSRSIFWAQALHLRTPVDNLQNIEPELASTLRRLSWQLEQASFRDVSQNTSINNQPQLRSIEAIGARCRQLNEEWDQAVNTVRMVPGFEDFLQPKTIASLRQAAISGPIIILLASKSSCSALIVKSSVEVHHVRLPALDVKTVEHYADLPRALSERSFDVNDFLDAPQIHSIFRRVLADMWQTIVKPVFDALNLKKSENLSRLWWCPTGVFAFVPIHAAGIYDTDPTDCVSDYVLSSYTPTLAALLDPPTATRASFKMTAVIEPNAPKLSPLPGTAAELAAIVEKVPEQWLTSVLSPTGSEVIDILQESSIVHFACHGIQDSNDPLDSGLMLSDGRLKVSQIMQQDTDSLKTNEKVMSFAFLGACETAKGDTSMPDDAMHLAATLLFAGFRGIVATMWTMNDNDGHKIAGTFYEHLFRDCDANSRPPVVPDLTKAAEALHLAVCKLRKEPGMTFERWVPFVHYGL